MAEAIDFTIAAIEAIKAPASGRVDYRDAKTPCLYLRVTSTGIKTFSFMGRAKGSARLERITFGKYPAVKPEEARRKAKVLAGELASGVSAASASRQQRGELTLGELWKLYRASLELRKKRLKVPDWLWASFIAPSFGRRRLSDLTATELERWHRSLPAAIAKEHHAKAQERYSAALAAYEAKLEARKLRAFGPPPRQPEAPKPPPENRGHRTANMALNLVRALYNFAAEPKRGHFAGVNPAAKHDLFPEVERERFLQPDELRPFFEALAQEPNTTLRDFVLLALLTGARRSNVAAMRWDELNLERGEWRVAGTKMKNGKPQTITLGPEAVAILEQRRAEPPSPDPLPEVCAAFVFPSPKAKAGHIQDPKSVWRRLLGQSGLTDLRLHDLRRTLGSWQARTGASLAIIGKSLNHKSHEATAIYARLDLDPVRQSIERATGAMLEAAGAKTAGKVIQLQPTDKARPKAAK